MRGWLAAGESDARVGTAHGGTARSETHVSEPSSVWRRPVHCDDRRVHNAQQVGGLDPTLRRDSRRAHDEIADADDLGLSVGWLF